MTSSDQSSSDTEQKNPLDKGDNKSYPRCDACGSVVIGRSQIPVRTSSNAPDGGEAVTLLLCDPCEFGLRNELLGRSQDTDTGRSGGDAGAEM